MSEEFHVHGHHEHMLEEGVRAGRGLNQYVALFTALMSALGAAISYEGGNTQTEALLLNEEAILYKTSAADQWAYYQAESVKLHIAELKQDLGSADQREASADEIKKYAAKKADIRANAEALDKRAAEAGKQSREAAIPHRRFTQALTFVQIAIALASITALTGRAWLFAIAGVAALAGFGHLAAAWLGV